MTTYDAIQPDPDHPVQAPVEKDTGSISNLPVDLHPESPVHAKYGEEHDESDFAVASDADLEDDAEVDPDDDTPDDGSDRTR